MRVGTTALIGRSNVGKSTFLNRVLGEPLAIVSPKPQTTRDALLGVVHRPDAQVAFLDTPGLHRPRSELGRRMNAAAFDAARSADVVVFMTDIGRPPSPGRRRASPRRRTPAARALEVPAEDRALLELLPPVRTLLLVVNKVDTIRDKTLLLPLFETYSAVRGFDAIMPISAKTGTGTREVLDEIARRLPEGTTAFDADTLTNRGTGYLAAEYIREQILLRTDAEVPHAVAVTIEQFEEAEEVVRIAATIHVEKVGQRKVMVGRGGTQLGEIGAASRRRIADLLGKRVRLDLFVRVSDRWKDAPRRLAELGFEPPETTLANLIPIKRSGRRGKT